MMKGKTAVVTGGGKGIGRAICLALAARGANLVVNYCGSEEKARQTMEECRALGVCAKAVRADVSTAEGAELLIKSAVEAFGNVDFLINNAGITRDRLLMQMKEEEFDEVIRVNLKGAFLCTKAVSRPMMKQRFGRIINITSVVGLLGNAGQANYAASKAGLIGLTKSAARELASRGVTVNAVAPGFIESDMTAALPPEAAKSIGEKIPLGRMGQPEDVAASVAFLCGEEAAYLTGQVLCVDGGMAM